MEIFRQSRMDASIQTQLFTKAAGSQLCKHAGLGKGWLHRQIFTKPIKIIKTKKISFVTLLFVCLFCFVSSQSSVGFLFFLTF